MQETLNKYVSLFCSLHTNKQKGMPAPHKAVLLLSVIDMIEAGVIKSNECRTFRMKKSQMNEVKTKCASSAQSTASWNSIDWDKCEQWVRKLQLRIAKAQKEKRHNKVNALRHLLVTSFYAKALAVKRVTSNKVKRTAGVDKVKWTTPVDKSKAIADLKRRGYHPHPLKRVYIAKSNGEKETAGNSHHERQSHASSVSDGTGTHNRNDGGRQLLRIP